MRTIVVFLLSIATLVSCEKVVLDNVDDTAGGNLIVNTSTSEESSGINETKTATRALRPLSELCTHITYALYQDGTRVKYVNQKLDDDNFGSALISIPKGIYTLVVIGHSGETNVSSLYINKLTFGGKVTDTFEYCEEIEVTDEPKTIEAVLTRIVAMVRLKITGNIPANAAKLKFYYTGGSSSLDGETKLGCVVSRQTEYRDVSPSQTTYDIFTFPHEEKDVLQITVTAYDAVGNELIERLFSDIQVTTNYITCISGDFFDGSIDGFTNTETILKADNEWAGQTDYTY